VHWIISNPTYVSERQRRPLPLLRLHRPPKIRTESLRRRPPPARETRTSRPAPTRQRLPRRTANRERTDEGNRRGRKAPARAPTTTRVNQRRDHPCRARARALLRSL
jgi:hypothetical protein